MDTSPQTLAYVPALHSLIEPAALSRLTQRDFGLHAVRPVYLIQSGLNDHYELHTGQGDVVIGVYRSSWRSNERVIWELEFIEHLAGCGAPGGAGVARTDGSWFSEIRAIEGVRQIAVVRHAPGLYAHFGASS